MRFSGEANDLRPVQRQHQTLTGDTTLQLQALLEQLSAPEPVVDAALLTSVQQGMRARLRDSAQTETALATLERLQQWQSGCVDCAMALRDQLLLWLPAPLPALRYEPASWQALREALNTASAEEVAP